MSAPTFTASVPTATGTVGTAYSQQVSISGGKAPYSNYSAMGLSAIGLSISSTGLITGTPTGTCTCSVVVTATDSSTGTGPYTGTAAAFTLTISAATTPTVTGISPGSGSTLGGASVTLAGTNFTGATAVKIGGTAVTSFTVVSSTSITAITPAGTAGTASVLVTTPGGTNAANTLYTYVTPTVAPTVTGVSPSSGSTAGGASVTLAGTNFTGATAVTIGGVAVTSFTVVSATSITAITPAGTAGTASVLVTTPGGTNAANSLYTYVTAAPTVTGISPSSGSTLGGTSVTLTGTNFTGATAVKIGGTAVTAFTVVSATSITATTPAGTAGGASVLVTTPGGSNAANTLYTYAAPTLGHTATLSNLVPSTGTLSPTFASATTTYTESVANTVGRLTLTPTTSDPNATVKVNGTAVASGTASGAITLAVGTTTIPVLVTAQDGTTTQTYTLTVTRAVAVPIAGPVSATVAYGSSANTIAASLSGGPATSLAISTAPAHGKATVSGTSFSYTPASGYSGQDSFAYTATNSSGTSAPATVSVTVSAPAAPTVAPVAANVTYNSAGTAVTLSPSGVYTRLKLASQPAHGTATLSGTTATYTPASGYSGVDSFTYTATGPGGTSSAATVSLTVAAPPPPTATAQQVTVSVSTSANSNATTINLASAVTNATGLIIVTPPAHGTATVSGFTILYTPNVGYFGTDSFTYAAIGLPSSGTGGTTALLTVKAGPAGVGQGAASWGDQAVALGAGSGVGVNPSAATSTPATVSITIPPPALVMTPTSLPAATSSSYNQTLSVSGGTAPYTFAISAGALPAGIALSNAGVLSGAPTAAGTFTFTVKATDSSTGSGPFSVAKAYSLTASLPGPVAQPIAAKIVAGQSLTLNVTQAASGAPFTGVTITTPPAKGTATVSGQTIVYTAPATFSGTVTFSYALSNAFGTSAPAVVTLTVNPLPTAAGTITIKVSANTSATADITQFATGGPFTGATLVSLSPANAGAAVIVKTSGAAGMGATYALNFTPGLHFSGAAVATYTLSNAYATSAQSTVIFEVSARPDPSQDPDVRALLTAQRDTSFRFAEAQMSNFNERLESLHTATGTTATNGIKVSLGDGPQPDMPGDAERRKAALETAKLFAGDYPCQLPGQAPEVYAACPTGQGPSTDPTRLGDAGSGPGGGASGLPGSSGFGLVKTSLDSSAPDASGGLGLSDAAAGGGASGVGGAAKPSGISDRLSIWTGGAIDLGLRHTTGFATGPQTPGSSSTGSTPGSQSTGFKFTSAGVSMGADYRLDNKLTLGAGLGYGEDTTKIGTDGTRDQAQSYLGVLYGDYRVNGHSFVDALLGYGDLQFQTRRFSAAFDEMEYGRRTGGEVFGALTYSLLYGHGPWSISPYGRVDGVQGTLNAFAEDGGVGALSYASQSIQSLKTTLGIHGDYSFKTSFGIVSPKFRLEYQREFEGAGAFQLQYADWLSGATYAGSEAPQGHDTIVFGLGADVLMQSFKFSFQYKLDADAYQTVNELTGRVDYKF